MMGGAVVGVVRGAQEFGPRALGHRSLLAYPGREVDGLKDRLNRIKGREWYRPVCPVVAAESSPLFFGVAVDSPYMSFAPRLLPEALVRFPHIAHCDGTSRVQTVTESDDPWLYALLQAVAARNGGFPILANTSFNPRVKGEGVLFWTTLSSTPHPEPVLFSRGTGKADCQHGGGGAADAADTGCCGD